MDKDDREMLVSIFWLIVTIIGGFGVGSAVLVFVIGIVVLVLNKLAG